MQGQGIQKEDGGMGQNFYLCQVIEIMLYINSMSLKRYESGGTGKKRKKKEKERENAKTTRNYLS